MRLNIDSMIEKLYSIVEDNYFLSENFNGMPKYKTLELFFKADYPGQICLFPHNNKLPSSKKRVSMYFNTPYKLELAKGAGQLDYGAFDISVLDHYHDNPRYSCKTNIINGKICIIE
jgi:hypothetical protein